MDVDARLEALEEENERLLARIEQLESLMGMRLIPPIEWRLTGSEARVFGVLMARPLATKDAIMAALYRDSAKEEAEIKIVDVFVCKLRKKVRPFGVNIETRWGEGYFLSQASKAAAQSMLEAA